MNIKETFQLNSRQAGFTLIELIIVIAIIALLAAATFVAVNPAKRIGDANNAQRWSDVTALADAWAVYIADNTGSPATTATDGITYAIASTTGGSSWDVCAAATGITTPTTTTAVLDLEALITGGYIGAVPTDPNYIDADDYQTGYYFYTDSTGAIKVGSCETYNSVEIEVIR